MRCVVAGDERGSRDEVEVLLDVEGEGIDEDDVEVVRAALRPDDGEFGRTTRGTRVDDTAEDVLMILLAGAGPA